MYAKLVNNELQYPNMRYWKLTENKNRLSLEKTEEMLLAEGFKQLVEDELPSIEAGEYIEEVYSEDDNNVYVTYVVNSVEVSKQEAYEKKVEEIRAYDVSASVNQVFVNDIGFWLSRTDRLALLERYAREEKNGIVESTLSTGGDNPIVLTLPTSWLISKIEEVCDYADSSYDVTQLHLIAVLGLLNDETKTSQDIADYDHTSGYPQKLNFNL